MSHNMENQKIARCPHFLGRLNASNMSQTTPSASQTTKEPVIEQQETSADPPSNVDTIVAKVLEALKKQQQLGTSGSSSGSGTAPRHYDGCWDWYEEETTGINNLPFWKCWQQQQVISWW